MEGPPGPRGPTGIQGIQGGVGAPGLRGAIGQTGVRGVTGPDGVQGFVGLPRTSVPVQLQIFSSIESISISTQSIDARARTTNQFPPLISRNSTAISGMSLDVNDEVITVPSGRYLVEGACTFVDTGILNNGRFNLVTNYIADPLSYIPIVSGNETVLGVSGTTSSFSSFYEFSSNTNVSIMYTGSLKSIPQSTYNLPLVVDGSAAFFVSFLKV